MDIGSRGAKVTMATLSGSSWVALFGEAAWRILEPGAVWLAAVMLPTVAVASTSTLTLALMHTVPSLFAAWAEGVAYGRKVEVKRSDMGPERGGLRAVR